MTTRASLITEKYEILTTELKTFFDAELFPSLDSIDVADLVYFITMNFIGIENPEDFHEKIKDLIVDLRFRGDYDGRSRALIQKHVVNNDIESLAAALSKKDNWKNVPKDRFDRRVEYMNKAVEEKKKINAAINLQNAFRMTRP